MKSDCFLTSSHLCYFSHWESSKITKIQRPDKLAPLVDNHGDIVPPTTTPENFHKNSSTTPEKFQKNSSATPET